MKVRATKPGYYGEKRRRVGDVFDIEAKAKKDLPSWVEAVEEDKPRRGGNAKAQQPDPEPDGEGGETDQAEA